MGAAGSIGRTGGLAVALGIGAAVVSGYGVAWADSTGESGGQSPSSSSSSPNTSTGPSSPNPTAPVDGAPSTPLTPGTPSGTVDLNTSTPAADADAAPQKTPQSKKPEPATDLSKTVPGLGTVNLPAVTPLRNRPTISPSLSTPARPASEPKADLSTRPTTLVATKDTLDARPLFAPKDAGTFASTSSSRTLEVSQQQVVPDTATPQTPVDLALGGFASLVSSFVSPLAGNSPTTPPDSPAMWALMAAARKETFGPESMAASVVAAPPAVVAIEQSPPLAWLQQVPVFGPVFVTPIVAVIHQIPVIGDIIHPIIGYPIQLGLPAGTPVARDVKVISFDGTQIYVHFMPAAGLAAGQRAPTILDGPGLGMPGATNMNGTLLADVLTDNLGAVGVGTLRNAGYNVVTWDPRGEYSSGGQLEVDSPDFEARDVSAIISWLATQPEARLDGDPADLNPRIGMVGVSYGGGIQLVTAGIDHRIDAIVPTIAWHSLNTSLYKNESFKSGWGTILEAALLATFARPNPRLLPAAIYGDLTGMVTPADQELLADRGPGGLPRDLVNKITAPTLLIQGTVDTLFTLQEADDNAMQLIANGVPTKVLWFCGGHGVCTNNLFDTRDGALIEQRTLEWLDRYVKGDETVDTGPQFEWPDQHGQFFSSNVYPVATGDPITASSSGASTLPLVPLLGGSGPLLLVLPIGGTKASNAVNLTVPAAATTTYIVGAPQLTLTYSGTGLARHVYAQLVDDATGLVLGNQVTPVPVTLDGQEHTVSIPLEMVAATLQPGQTVTMQLVASAASYQTIWTAGVLNVSSLSLSLPTAANAVPVSPLSVAALAGVA